MRYTDTNATVVLYFIWSSLIRFVQVVVVLLIEWWCPIIMVAKYYTSIKI